MSDNVVCMTAWRHNVLRVRREVFAALSDGELRRLDLSPGPDASLDGPGTAYYRVAYRAELRARSFSPVIAPALQLVDISK